MDVSQSRGSAGVDRRRPRCDRGDAVRDCRASSARSSRIVAESRDRRTAPTDRARSAAARRCVRAPARVGGSAGTGKTIVALHRAVHLARTHEDVRVLLTTFSDTLANALRLRLRLLIGNQPRIAERLKTQQIPNNGRRLYTVHFGAPRLASEAALRRIFAEAPVSS